MSIRLLAAGMVGGLSLVDCEPARQTPVEPVVTELSHEQRSIVYRHQQRERERLRDTYEAHLAGERWAEAADALEAYAAIPSHAARANLTGRVRELRARALGPPELDGLTWLQGTPFATADGVTLVLLLDGGPHSRREMAALEARVSGRLQVIGVLGETFGQDPRPLVQGVSFPVALDELDAIQGRYEVGAPNVLVSRGDRLLGSTHPARISEDMVDSWARSPESADRHWQLGVED